jgi:hypothetical protein
MAVVFVRTLTGRLPFANVRAESAVMLRSLPEREFLPEVPESVAKLLIRALAFEPNERPRNMTEFRDELLAALTASDRHAPWPTDSTVSHCPAQSALADAIAADPSPPRYDSPSRAAAPALARPGHVNTRTLTGAQVLGRAGRAVASRPLRTLLVAASIAAALALSSSGGSPQGGGEAMIIPERAPELVRHVESLQPASRLDRAEATPPPVAPTPHPVALPHAEPPAFADATPPAVASAAPASTIAPHEPRRRSASETPRMAGERPPPRARTESAPTVRVGANRAPIIE